MRRPDDGVRLYLRGDRLGTPLIFVHEFGGDYRSWEPQMRYFAPALSRHHLCRARLSAVRCAGDVERYSQARAADDIMAVLDHLRSSRRTSSDCRWAASPRCISASAIRRARVAVVAGCGYGAEPGSETSAPRRRRSPPFETHGMASVRGEIRARPDARAVPEQGPARLGGVREQLAEHSALGSANTSSACNASGPRSTIWWIVCGR